MRNATNFSGVTNPRMSLGFITVSRGFKYRPWCVPVICLQPQPVANLVTNSRLEVSPASGGQKLAVDHEVVFVLLERHVFSVLAFERA